LGGPPPLTEFIGIKTFSMKERCGGAPLLPLILETAELAKKIGMRTQTGIMGNGVLSFQWVYLPYYRKLYKQNLLK